MAVTIAVLISLIAVANAGFWKDDNDNWSPFQQIKMPNIQFPPIPMPVFPRLPTPPQLLGFPFAGFQMPVINFPKIHIPSPADIANIKPGPNQVFNGIAVKSSSSIGRDKDGNPVRTGGTSMVVNENGEVYEHKTGNSPPDLNQPIVFPPMPAFKPFAMPPMPPMPPMQPMKPIKPIQIDPNEIEGHEPGPNEHYSGSFHSVSSHYSNDNGKVTSGGSSTSLVNNDGDVEKESVVFGDGDKE